MTERTPADRRHKPTNQGVVTLNGGDHHLGKHNTPERRAEYDRLIAPWLASGGRLQSKSGSCSDLTVAELILTFLKHVAKHYRDAEKKPTQEVQNLKDAIKPLRKLYSHPPAAESGPLALRAVREASRGERQTAGSRFNCATLPPRSSGTV